MSGLFSILQLGREALRAQQLALEVTKNNIANVNTPGYARERAQIVENSPLRIGPLVIGRGATVTEIQVFRDRFVEIRLSQEQQKVGYLSGRNDWLAQLEAVFDESKGSGIQDALTAFFGSFLQLSSDPTNTSLRQNVLTRANQLASVIRSRSESLESLRLQTNQQLVALTSEINRLTDQISSLNVQIVPLQAGGADAAAIRDKRDLAIQKLSELIDISYYENDNGTVVVSTTAGRALVTAGRAKPLAVTKDSNGNAQLLVDGTDITSEIIGGRLGAALNVRNTVIAGLHSQLDTLANDLLARVNAVHQNGFDLGSPQLQGGAFFVLDPNAPSGTHAAARLQVAITDAKKIAAATSTNPDDNTNAKALFALSTEPRAAFGNLSYGEFTSSAISTSVANEAHANEDKLRAEQALLVQLQRQRESVSGVNLDEEALDMIRYQRAFEASSRFLSIISNLTEDLIKMFG